MIVSVEPDQILLIINIILLILNLFIIVLFEKFRKNRLQICNDSSLLLIKSVNNLIKSFANVSDSDDNNVDLISIDEQSSELR